MTSATSAKARRLLVAVGSRSDKVCSIGAFARAEARALAPHFEEIEILEPDQRDRYPVMQGIFEPDVILFHAPSLHDRKYPWNALWSALRLRMRFPRARFIPVVHEFSEAPRHWKARQIAILKMSSGAIVNSKADEAGLSPWSSRLSRIPLGPTLFFEDFFNGAEIQQLRVTVSEAQTKSRQLTSALFKIDGREKWLLHAGLLTAGKGVDFLAKLGPQLKENHRLILMGGIGPKERDRRFAEETLRGLKRALGRRFTFIDSPTDEIYKQVLLASDLVVLPYDDGVSERRSSFLSAASCGSNIWATTGKYSLALGIDSSGTHQIAASLWRAEDPLALRSVVDAVEESESQVLERRLKNLSWAATRSWKARAESMSAFIENF